MKMILKAYLLVGIFSVLILNGCATAMLTESADDMYSISEPVRLFDNAFINNGTIALEFTSYKKIDSDKNDTQCIQIKNDQCLNNRTIFHEYENSALSHKSYSSIKPGGLEKEGALVSSNKVWESINTVYINIVDAINEKETINAKTNYQVQDKIISLIKSGYFQNKNKQDKKPILYIVESIKEPSISASRYSSRSRITGILSFNDMQSYYVWYFQSYTYLGQGGHANKIKYLGVPFAFALDVLTFPISIPMYYGLKNMGN